MAKSARNSARNARAASDRERTALRRAVKPPLEMAGLVPAISLGARPQDPRLPKSLKIDAQDEIIAGFATLRDYFRYAISRFNAAHLAFGHGATNALDEAAFLLLEALHLPIDTLDPFLDARLTLAERARILSLIEARATTRKPAAYLVNRAYIQGEPFYVDERVIVPRSFIGELLFHGLAGEGALIENPGEIADVLDLCTGGGSLAILAARVFPNAHIDAVDLSRDALAVARRNVDAHGLAERVALFEGDLFAPLDAKRYDLILTNPPYVETAAVLAFPPEFAAEPRLAHDGGSDGLAIVRRILQAAPGHLVPDGALVCEIGGGRARLEAEFPALPLIWLDTQESEGEVFFARAADFAAPSGRKKRRSIASFPPGAAL
jgi:ribosomal protein L3 glutamine methyltransferase